MSQAHAHAALPTQQQAAPLSDGLTLNGCDQLMDGDDFYPYQPACPGATNSSSLYCQYGLQLPTTSMQCGSVALGSSGSSTMTSSGCGGGSAGSMHSFGADASQDGCSSPAVLQLPSPACTSAAAAAAAAAAGAYYSSAGYASPFAAPMPEPSLGYTGGYYGEPPAAGSVSAITAWSNRYINSMQANLVGQGRADCSPPPSGGSSMQLLASKHGQPSPPPPSSAQSLLYAPSMDAAGATQPASLQHSQPNAQMLLYDQLRPDGDCEMPGDCSAGSYCTAGFAYDGVSAGGGAHPAAGAMNQLLPAPVGGDFYMCAMPQSTYAQPNWSYN